MALLELFLIFVLQFEGISGKTHYLYHRPGNDVVLPCEKADYKSSNNTWRFHKHPSDVTEVVHKGDVVKKSAKFSRLSVYSNCSLGIKNITAEDAGYYSCVYEMDGFPIKLSEVYLNILTVSASPSHTDSQRDGDVTLECSLFRYCDAHHCEQNSIRWVNETGTELRNSFTNNTDQMKLVSLLTVKHQSGQNKRYTCQIVKENSVQIEAHYTPVLIDPTARSPLSYVMGALRIGGLILMIAVTVLIIRHRRRKKTLEDTNVHYVGDRDDGTVNYENVGNSSAGPELR